MDLPQYRKLRRSLEQKPRRRAGRFPSAQLSTFSPRTCMTDPPDGPRAIVGNQQRAIRRGSHADRPPPDIPIRRKKSSEKILVHSARLSVLERNPHHLVTRAHRPIPRTMLARENIAFVPGGKLR